jgi:hypothetical protein
MTACWRRGMLLARQEALLMRCRSDCSSTRRRSFAHGTIRPRRAPFSISTVARAIRKPSAMRAMWRPSSGVVPAVLLSPTPPIAGGGMPPVAGGAGMSPVTGGGAMPPVDGGQGGQSQPNVAVAKTQNCRLVAAETAQCDYTVTTQDTARRPSRARAASSRTHSPSSRNR